jgi:hypothetical protein
MSDQNTFSQDGKGTPDQANANAQATGQQPSAGQNVQQPAVAGSVAQNPVAQGQPNAAPAANTAPAAQNNATSNQPYQGQTAQAAATSNPAAPHATVSGTTAQMPNQGYAAQTSNSGPAAQAPGQGSAAQAPYQPYQQGYAGQRQAAPGQGQAAPSYTYAQGNVPPNPTAVAVQEQPAGPHGEYTHLSGGMKFGWGVLGFFLGPLMILVAWLTMASSTGEMRNDAVKAALIGFLIQLAIILIFSVLFGALACSAMSSMYPNGYGGYDMSSYYSA